jgi:hypothetical protein
MFRNRSTKEGEEGPMLKPEHEISRQARWQRKHRAMGLCVLCSRPAFKGWRCKKHYEQHKITMRLRYIPKVRGRYKVGGATEAAGKKTAAKARAGAKKTTARKVTAKKATAKKATAKSATKAATRKTTARKTTAKRSTARRSARG